MKKKITITAVQISQWMTATAAIQQALVERNETMSYGDLLRIVGMTPDGWKGQYSQRQSSNLLNSLSYVEVAFGISGSYEEALKKYGCFINKSTGKPGAGLYTRNVIIKEKINGKRKNT